ncbi:MAG TPA: hypothetical protein VHM31_24795 [Polyangia bacterium]|nr:hypothetical protein [Polyangia bacterium]
MRERVRCAHHVGVARQVRQWAALAASMPNLAPSIVALIARA